ncbi:MAG: hypothetical protein P8Z68_05925 [Kineosporiaceae bacterium]
MPRIVVGPSRTASINATDHTDIEPKADTDGRIVTATASSNSSSIRIIRVMPLA